MRGINIDGNNLQRQALAFHRVAVDQGADALPGNLLDIFHPAVVRLVRIRGAERVRDWMGRIPLHVRGQMQQLRFLDDVGVNRRDVKHALRQRAGLVENHRLGVRQKF